MSKVQKNGKVQSLINQFPLLLEIIGDWDQQKKVVHIKVKQVDPDVLFFKGENKDGKTCAVLHNKENWRGKQEQEVRLIGVDDFFYPHMMGGEFRNSKRVIDYIGCKNLDNIKAIVIKTTYSWYKDSEYTDNLGEIQHEDTYITIYMVPKVGLEKIIEESDVAKNVTLHSYAVMNAISQQDSTYNSVTHELNNLTNQFVFGIYVKGLQTTIDTCKQRAMSGKFNDIALRSFVSAGIVMMTICGPKAQITFICVDGKDDPLMGVQSYEGKLPDIVELVESLIQSWKELEAPFSDVYKYDAEVRMA